MIQEAIFTSINKRDEEHVSSGRLSGSRSSYCLRRLGYYLLKYPAIPMTAKGSWIVTMGTVVHEYVQKCLVEQGKILLHPDGSPMIEVHVETDDKLFHGYIDGVLARDHILELKSCAVEKLEKMIEPGPWHLPQANLYAYLFGASKITFGYIGIDARQAYPNEDLDLPIREFTVDYNPTIARLVLDRFYKAYKLSQNGKLNPREYDIRALVTQCSFCEYRTSCYPIAQQELPVDRDPLFPEIEVG